MGIWKSEAARPRQCGLHEGMVLHGEMLGGMEPRFQTWLGAKR